MNIVITDIHADSKSLKKIFEVLEDEKFLKKYGSPETIINLGDVLERGYEPLEVLEILKKHKIISVLGNHDEAFLYKRFVSGSDYLSRYNHERVRKRITPFFDNMKQFKILENIYVVHGGPLELGDDWLLQKTWQRLNHYEFFDFTGYHYTPESAFDSVKELFEENFVVLCGHQHQKMIFAEKEKKVRDVFFEMKRKKMNFAKTDFDVFELKRKDENYIVCCGISGGRAYRVSSDFVIFDDEKILFFSFTV